LKDDEIGHSPSSGGPSSGEPTDKIAESFDPNAKRTSRFAMKINDESLETIDISN
jgi:hypothetical protein